VVLAAAGVSAVATLPAGAAAEPASPVGATRGISAVAHQDTVRFLEPSQLPQGRRYGTWQAGPVTPGLPDPLTFCLEEALPSEGAQHRVFYTDVDAAAEQVAITLPDEDSARLIAKEAVQAIERCADRLNEQNPEGAASWQSYGHYKIEDGLSIYGVFTWYPNSETGAHLYGVGRDGDTVTVVHLGQMGTAEDAPVPAFKKTARVALKRL
jgi:hypothetical protein